jgi:uncharacterized protein YceK
MKVLLISLMVIVLMSCASLRYDDNLKEPYTQTEVEISGAGTIIITALGIITYGIIADANNF